VDGSGRYQAVKGAEDDGGDNWYRVFPSAIWSQCVSGGPYGQENEGGSSPKGPHDVDMGGYLGNDTVTAVGPPIGLVFCWDFNFLRPGGGGALRSEVEGGKGVHSNRVCLWRRRGGLQRVRQKDPGAGEEGRRRFVHIWLCYGQLIYTSSMPRWDPTITLREVQHNSWSGQSILPGTTRVDRDVLIGREETMLYKHDRVICRKR
jgi:hypothetical protein